jgi:hypothetical protein
MVGSESSEHTTEGAPVGRALRLHSPLVSILRFGPGTPVPVKKSLAIHPMVSYLAPANYSTPFFALLMVPLARRETSGTDSKRS